MIIMFGMSITACEDFVEISVPNDKIVSSAVFENDDTAKSAMTGIYNELFNATFSGGWSHSITVLADLSADVLQPINPESPTYGELYQNDISPGNALNHNLWSSAYSIIYMVNSLLEGLDGSKGLSMETKNRLEGEARFVRAFTYFYLTNIYGDVPLVLNTDYRSNSLVPRTGSEEVEVQIFSDLERAMGLLETGYLEGERTHVNKSVVMAFLARVHLYHQHWSEAETWSSAVLSQTSIYGILVDLNQVFLANSQEAIWQISPIGRGNIITATNEGQAFIGTSRSAIKLADGFVESLSANDKRLSKWIGHFTNPTRNFYYPYKYKDRSSIRNITEYSMVLRLAEQYLIRAEARAMQGKLPGAISDVDKIKVRAGLLPIAEIDPGIGREALVKVIMEERKKEFFAEWGHRWFDLKRTTKAMEVLQPIKGQWKNTSLLYPVPEEERMKNPNLDQNEGY